MAMRLGLMGRCGLQGEVEGDNVRDVRLRARTCPHPWGFFRASAAARRLRESCQAAACGGRQCRYREHATCRHGPLAVSKLPWEAMDPQAGTAPGRPPSTTNFFNVETAAFGSRRSEMTCIRVSMRSCKRSMAT